MTFFGTIERGSSIRFRKGLYHFCSSNGLGGSSTVGGWQLCCYHRGGAAGSYVVTVEGGAAGSYVVTIKGGVAGYAQVYIYIYVCVCVKSSQVKSLIVFQR